MCVLPLRFWACSGAHELYRSFEMRLCDSSDSVMTRTNAGIVKCARPADLRPCASFNLKRTDEPLLHSSTSLVCHSSAAGSVRELKRTHSVLPLFVVDLSSLAHVS